MQRLDDTALFGDIILHDCALIWKRYHIAYATINRWWSSSTYLQLDLRNGNTMRIPTAQSHEIAAELHARCTELVPHVTMFQ